MLVLTIRSDNPMAEIGLFDDGKKMKYVKWEAHRELAETIHKQIAKILQFIGKDWADIGGIVCYKGPGSFTGLRIGLTVGNSLALGLKAPIVSETDEDWIEQGINRLIKGDDEKIAMPEYGSEAHITKQKK